jgi:hypothetical protein
MPYLKIDFLVSDVAGSFSLLSRKVSADVETVRVRQKARSESAGAVIPVVVATAAAVPAPDLANLYFAIESTRRDDRALIVQFVGVAGGEGVSTLAEGFARQSARDSQSSILLVDCDTGTGLTRDDDATPGGQDGAKTADQAPPLPSLLTMFMAGRPLKGALAPARDGGTRNGRSNIRHAQLGKGADAELDLRMLAAFAEALRGSFSVVVLDCPPISVSPLATVLARIADGTIIVAAAGQTRRRRLHHTIAEISRMGGQVIGLVLNRQRDWLPTWLRRHMD